LPEPLVAGGRIPDDNGVAASDFILLHDNRVGDADRISEMVRETRAKVSYRRLPILFNEHDHFDLDNKLLNYCGIQAGRVF
jgi:hypothetical protein